MGKRHAEHPVEKGSFLDDFLEWMDSSEGQQSIEAHDLVFDALENAGVDPRQRKIVWATGNGCRSSSRRNASMPAIRTYLSTRSKFTWSVGSKAARRNPAPNASSRNLTGSSGRGSTTMSVRHGLPKNSRELGTLKYLVSSGFA